MILGFFISATSMVVVCWIFPPEGLGQGEKSIIDPIEVFEA
jgi:hypothetical protein